MSIFAWATRRVGGLSIVALLALVIWVLSNEIALGRVAGKDLQQQGKLGHQHHTTARSRSGGNWTIFYAYYGVLIHTLVLMFPLRACWAVLDLTRSLKKVNHNKLMKDLKHNNHQRRLSSTSLSSAETLTSSQSSSSSSEAGDIELGYYGEADVDQDKVIHAILIPNYKEEIDGLRETLDVLASHPQARSQYDIYLAMESRESGAEVKALSLVSEFIKKFRFIDFTVHPGDIPGEAPGKSSNVAWAARKASERYSAIQRKDVIITGIDADSHLSSNYTSLITAMHLANPETATTTLYSAPIIFDRNAHLVPMLVRVADILWCAAGLSGLYTSSSIRPPTSVYSVPLELVDRVGGWDADPEAIGEDLHMYLKCFFALNGNLTQRTVLAPVSQTNVSGGGKGIRGHVAGFRARYKQAMRHMWGALDSGYAIRKVVEMWRDRKSTGRTFRPLHATTAGLDDIYIPQSDYENLLEQQPVENGVFSDVVQDTLKSPDYFRIFYLFHRLFEAHFLPVHMAILVISSGAYVFIRGDKPDDLGIAWTFDAMAWLRLAGFVAVPLYFIFYESYHRICVESREAEMKAVGLADHMTFSFRTKKYLLDYFIFPLVAPAYGSIPAAQAQICHFWTLDLVYSVSKKHLRQRAKSLVQEVLGA